MRGFLLVDIMLPDRRRKWGNVLRTVIAAALLMLSLAPAARGGDSEDCDNAATLLKSDPQRVVAACRRLGDKGDVAAQFKIAAMYYLGSGMPRDYAQAARWYRMAAEQGSPVAQLSLGALYGQGLGVPQDDLEAVMWIRQAAGSGLAAAELMLGLAYRDGKGVQKDMSAAVQWIRKAAEQGLPNAQFALGWLYLSPKINDYAQAYFWFSLAAQGYPSGRERDIAMAGRDTAAQWLNPGQLKDMQKLARDWQPTTGP
jgi:hypothetical protein